MSNISIDDFSLLSVIGKGDFGKILLVCKKDTRELFAMKSIKKQRLSRQSQIERVRTERTILEQVSHPFIVKLQYAFQTAHKLYLVIEYCPGGELINYLPRRFEESTAKFYAGCIVLALEYLHSRNIIYRDLRPENLLIDRSGYLKLTDFGFSKQNVKSNTYTMVDTSEYVAPEIIRAVGHGKAADWWSFGCLLFELLTGNPPFTHTDERKLQNKILHEDVQFPDFLTEEAKDLLNGLFNRNPHTRLGTNSESVKRHPWFTELNWGALYRLEIPPPKIQIVTEERKEDSSSPPHSPNFNNF